MSHLLILKFRSGPLPVPVRVQRQDLPGPSSSQDVHGSERHRRPCAAAERGQQVGRCRHRHDIMCVCVCVPLSRCHSHVSRCSHWRRDAICTYVGILLLASLPLTARNQHLQEDCGLLVRNNNEKDGRSNLENNLVKMVQK